MVMVRYRHFACKTCGLVASTIIRSSREHTKTSLEGVGISNAELSSEESATGEAGYRNRIGVDIICIEYGSLHCWRSCNKGFHRGCWNDVVKHDDYVLPNNQGEEKLSSS